MRKSCNEQLQNGRSLVSTVCRSRWLEVKDMGWFSFIFSPCHCVPCHSEVHARGPLRYGSLSPVSVPLKYWQESSQREHRCYLSCLRLWLSVSPPKFLSPFHALFPFLENHFQIHYVLLINLIHHMSPLLRTAAPWGQEVLSVLFTAVSAVPDPALDHSHFTSPQIHMLVITLVVILLEGTNWCCRHKVFVKWG